MSVAVHDFEYLPDMQVYAFVYDQESWLIGVVRPDPMTGKPNLVDRPIGIGETYRKALADLQENELK